MTIKITGHVDQQRRLVAQVPDTVAPGPVELELILSEDEAEQAWTEGIAREWADELADKRQDIYTLSDGEPIDGAR